MRSVGALALWVLACAASCDGRAGAPNCAAADGGYALGTIPGEVECLPCSPNEAGDEACAALYGDRVPAECRAVCRDQDCGRRCPGECWFTPDAGGCTPGELDCYWFQRPIMCDPTCGAGGGCRGCASDSDCELELGPGSMCQRHCGTCCRPADDTTPTDGGFPCGCA